MVEAIIKANVYIDRRKLVPCKKNPTGRTRYYVFVRSGKKRWSHGGFDRLRDAKAQKRLLEAQIANGTYGKINEGTQLFSKFHARWWSSKKKSLAPGGARQYETSFRLRILPFFSNFHLEEVTTAVVQDFVDSMGDLSPSYAHTVYAHFRTCIRNALELGYVERNPCVGVILPHLEKTLQQRLEPSQARALVDKAAYPGKALFAILVYAGMRIGEALALRLKDTRLQTGIYTLSELGIQTLENSDLRRRARASVKLIC